MIDKDEKELSLRNSRYQSQILPKIKSRQVS